MRTKLYIKLAWEGIRKNRRLYIPYILTGTLMVMMYYILEFLSVSPALAKMKGGATLSLLLPLGSGVIAVFSILFLFYTGSFLVRQRNKEFGLYNILGMDKKSIRKILFWENAMIACSSLLTGLIAGILLSKLAEAGLLNILGLGVDYRMNVSILPMETFIRLCYNKDEDKICERVDVYVLELCE